MSYTPEFVAGVFAAPILLLVAPPLAMVALVFVLVGALALLLALAAAIAASPYVVYRSVRSRRAQEVAHRHNAAPKSPRLKPVPSHQT